MDETINMEGSFFFIIIILLIFHFWLKKFVRYDILLNKSCGVIYSGEKFFFIIEKYIFLFHIWYLIR